MKFTCPKSSFAIDFTDLNINSTAFAELEPSLKKAHQGMLDIEAGKIKNPDENRKVTHFTDRIEYSKSPLFQAVEKFAQDIKTGRIIGSTGKNFDQVVINGIGGSALGPQLMQFAINGPYYNESSIAKRHQMPKIYFVDNTDPAGIRDLMAILDLESTLIASISKSGGTQETQNNMIGFETEFKKKNLNFTKHAVAITMRNSKLDKIARGNHWLEVFEMAESIGGRTSETSIVGHLPAALAGIDFASFLKGACDMDTWTRQENICKNPAYTLATAWYILGEGKGNRNMVIVPYADHLILLSRYMQQLVMESLGKEFNLKGEKVYQGLNVFGNKGGTDAHAFIQQLHDGRNDFFATFIEVLSDAKEITIADGVTMGDYLHGFERGLCMALRARQRPFIQIEIPEINTYFLGMIIALFERAVAFYSELIGINAFHQPGVEAYKHAAHAVIALDKKILASAGSIVPFKGDAQSIASQLGVEGEMVSEVEGILNKYAFNPTRELSDFSISRIWNSEKNNWCFILDRK